MTDYSLVPVEHQPDFENASLVPVDHDPFSADGVTQPAQSPQEQAQQAQTQPMQSQQAQTKQPAMGASRSSAPILGVATTESTGAAVTAGASDFLRSIPRGVVSGFNRAASALGRATQAEMGQDIDAPTPEQGMQILEKEVTGPMYRPEGRAGQFGASVGEFLGNPASYMAPGSVPLKVGAAVLGGLGSEAGGQLGEGTPWEGPLRFAGGALGVLGPLGAARLATGVRAAETLVPAATEGIGRAAGQEVRALTSRVRLSPAEWAAKKGFPGVGTTANGGPTFAGTEHLYPAAQGQRSVVNIPLTGSYRKDFALANKEGKFTETPGGYMWHHADDFNPQTGRATLELIDEDAHNATRPHAGSVAQYSTHHGVRYKR
ncbi:HNH endonuclease [Bradyrhizobium sp. 1]|uniref:HNH endonuclease signature motif containing protein n=1 Tax=Bradyrhizobium sp. 1 TaxID=241591 RepID=UPI001FFAB719|nr:HNH endonuclease [Bradyrhizobium sp. 1]MCK1393665.1 HNH endonuclease [Bradyrhizobium sp. 1]